MTTKKLKNNKSKKVNQEDINFYKQYLVFNEIYKAIELKLFFELEEELFEFIQKVISYDIIADFSQYGYDVFDLNFIDYVKGDKCFLCFIKFNFVDFVDFVIGEYNSVTLN